MLLTVTLNAAVDKTYSVEGFTLDRVHRPTESRIVAGGKGINVARVTATLGGRALATGFLGGYNGRFIERSLRTEGIAASFVRIAGESRVCIAVIDPRTGTQTEINEAGPLIGRRELGRLKARFGRLLRENDIGVVTLSGSTPPGVPATIYAELIAAGREAGVRTALDASGDALARGVAAGPWLVKPNAFELATLVGRHTEQPDEVAEAGAGLLARGVEVVAVTLGRVGAVVITDAGAWYAKPPEVEFVSAVGSGDAFLAAFLWARCQGACMPDALRLGVGAGAANAAVAGAGFCSLDQIRETARRVDVRSLPRH